jgi:hypothetical protein
VAIFRDLVRSSEVYFFDGSAAIQSVLSARTIGFHLMTLSAALLVASFSFSGITDRLADHLVSASPTEKISVIVVMEAQVDAAQLQKRTDRLVRRDRARAVREELQSFAKESQYGLDLLIDDLKDAQQITFSHRLWMLNSMRVTGTKSAILELAEQPGVDRVRFDPIMLPEETQDVGAPLDYVIGQAPFGTSFETSEVPSEIELARPALGRIETSSAFGPIDGLVHLTMDAEDATPGVNLDAELHVDLSGALEVTLDFSAQTFGSATPADGLFISTDGLNYHRALSFPSNSAYQNYNLDVDALLASLGQPLTSNTSFAFRWTATDALPTSGLTLDKLSVNASFASGVSVEPNISGLQADQLWSIGINGGRTFILNVDSGVANDHPDLANQIWSNPGEIPGNGQDDDNNGYIDDLWGWNFQANNNNPYDGGHGTNVAGILVGNGSGQGGVHTGMAPNAVMAVAKITNEGHAFAAYQYGIEIGVDVITSSHSFKWPFEPDYHLFRQSTEIALAAGIIHSNSLGNNGQQTFSYPVPYNIAAPANCPGPWIHPAQAQGAVGSVMGCAAIFLGSDDLDFQSGQGPSAWEDIDITSQVPWPHPQDTDFWDYPYNNGASPGLLKPDVCAYTNVKTTSGNSGYLNSFGGTSAATPHLGGALCLMVDANERALPRQISHALQVTAVDLGPAGKDPRYGAGKIQVFDAAMRVLSLVTAVPQENLVGDQANLEITGPVGSPYVLIVGFAQGLIPTTVGFDVEIAPPIYLFAQTHTGYSTPTVLPVSFPNDPMFSGIELFMQVATDDTTGTTGQWLISLLETIRWD